MIIRHTETILSRRSTTGPLVDRINYKALDWQKDGICNTVDPDLFFSEDPGGTKRAAQVCQGCPVRQQCLDWAIESNQNHGIAGGLGARARASERTRRNKRLAAAAVRDAETAESAA